MVLKNPYGYLIKHFRLIHLILAGIYIYLVIKVNGILSYFSRFIDGNASKLDAMSYVNHGYMIGIILSIVICIVVYILMRYKKKPRLLYLLLIGLYLIVPVLVSFSYGVLESIYSSVVETKTLLLYRDLFRILILFQYVSIIIVMVRGLGFDIKKFNFASDLTDLDLNEKDMEEIEVALGGTQSVQRRFHRRVRELRYYYVENKVFIVIIVIIIVGILGVSLFVNKEITNKEYHEGETFSSGSYQFMVRNTFVTSRDVHNNSFLSDSNHTFVIVRMLMGRVNDGEFNSGNLILKIGNQSYSSNDKYASRFRDLGYVFKGKLKGQDSYIFIFDVDSSLIHENMILEYANDKVVILNPVFLDEVSKEDNYYIGENIDLASSPLGRGSFLISSFDINQKFSYSYEYEIMGKKNTANLTISSSDNVILFLKIDSSLFANFTNYSFLSEYGKLKYQVGEEVFTSNVSDKTPKSYGEGVYLVVDKDVSQASKIWYEIIIRNCKYQYYIK